MKRVLRLGITVAAVMAVLLDSGFLFVWDGQLLNPKQLQDARITQGRVTAVAHVPGTSQRYTRGAKS